LLKSVESKQSASRNKRASSRTSRNTNKGKTLRVNPDDFKTRRLGEDFAKVPVGDGMYTFMTDHLPKTDINLAHQYIDTVSSQMHDTSFTLAWASYEYRNRVAHESYMRRVVDTVPIEQEAA
jgi:hypothetical protein